MPAPDSRTRRELGEAAAAVVEQADTVVAARLKVIAARKMAAETLTSDELINGSPYEAPPVPLGPAARTELLRHLFDDRNYLFGFARRCGNDYRVGVRFQRGEQRVEFDLGVPCMQSSWSVRVNGEVQRTGAIMTDEAARAVLQLVSDAGVRGAVTSRGD